MMCVSFFGFSQQYYGTTTFGTSQSETNYASAKDSQGNVYTVGFYSGILTVGSTTVTWEGGNADGYLTKHDAAGNPVWVKSFGGNLDDVAVAVTVDALDNILLTGYFQGAGVNSFDADPGANVYNLSQESSITSRDCFIVKLDNNGDFLWAKQVGNPSGGALNEDSKAIETDAAGNVYVVGSYRFADFDPSATTQYLLNAGGTGSQVNGFLLKLTSNGDFDWVKTFDSVNNSVIEGIDFDSLGNFFLLGRYDGVFDLDPSPTVTLNSTTSNGSNDVFLVKLTNSGNYSWDRVFGSTGSDLPKFVKTIGTNVYIGGVIAGTLDLDPTSGTNSYVVSGVSDGYISKFDTDGNYAFSYVVGGTGTEIEELYRMVEGPNGNLFISGTFTNTADVDFSASTTNIVSNGSLDNYVIEITPTGTYVNHIAFGGTLKEAFPKVEFSPNNYMFIIGSFISATIDFDPYAGVNTLSNNSSGTYDVYFTKLGWPGVVLSTDSFLAQDVKLYPNPVKDILTISSTNDIKSYTIYNSLGQMVGSGKIQANINFSYLSNGVYILNLEGESGVLSKKIIKE